MVDRTFLQVASALLVAIPAEILGTIIISRSIVERKSKVILHAITVILLYCYKSQASDLLSEGTYDNAKYEKNKEK